MKRPFLISLTVTLILTVALSGCGGSSRGGGTPGPLVLFSDDFESYPTGSWTGGGSWTVGESSDPWTIVQDSGTKILQSPYGSQGSLYVDNAGWTDYTVSARVRIDNARGTFWLYGRSSYVTETRYEFRLQNYLDGSISYFLEKLVKVGEVWYGYSLATMNRPFDIASWHEVKMVLAGGNIKCYVDEALIFDYNDTEDDVGLSGTNNGPPILTGGIGVDGAGYGGYSLDDVLVTE